MKTRTKGRTYGRLHGIHGVACNAKEGNTSLEAILRCPIVSRGLGDVSRFERSWSGGGKMRFDPEVRSENRSSFSMDDGTDVSEGNSTKDQDDSR